MRPAATTSDCMFRAITAIIQSMEIFNNIKEINSTNKTIVALGFFDGVHKGHRELISRCISDAKSTGSKSAVFTFKENPKNVMAGKNIIKRLRTSDEKSKILSDLNVDILFNLSFEDGFHEMSPDDFAKNLISSNFNASCVYCGYNFRFGKNASGNTKTLFSLGEKYGFEVKVIEPIEYESLPVSSSRIRELIIAGDIENANNMLELNYKLSGLIIDGHKLGRSIGFPTINIMPNDEMTIPAFGVYITYATIEGVKYPSVTNIGIKPTVGGNTLLIESHIIDFQKDVYGKLADIEFLKMLRPEQKFENFDALKDQISKDKEAAVTYFAE